MCKALNLNPSKCPPEQWTTRDVLYNRALLELYWEAQEEDERRQSRKAQARKLGLEGEEYEAYVNSSDRTVVETEELSEGETADAMRKMREQNMRLLAQQGGKG